MLVGVMAMTWVQDLILPPLDSCKSLLRGITFFLLSFPEPILRSAARLPFPKQI